MTTSWIIAITGIFFLAIFAFGFGLSRSGKPYHSIAFTLHKLIALGAIIFLAVIINNVHQLAPLDSLQIVVIAVTAIFIVLAITTGGLLSLDKAMPAVVQRFHQVIPFLALLSTSVLLYLLLFTGGSRSQPTL